ncbi:MAG TPA: hypothetical protein VK067_00175 [Pseudogracilibacillus sp.]|nr:hypothetical protein [Pseudogracilibacillus sp.]
MNEQGVQHTYIQFKHEFEEKLNRPLTEKEQDFLQWLAKKCLLEANQIIV